MSRCSSCHETSQQAHYHCVLTIASYHEAFYLCYNAMMHMADESHSANQSLSFAHISCKVYAPASYKYALDSKLYENVPLSSMRIRGCTKADFLVT